MALAAVIGQFIGAVLDQCGPSIVRILRDAFRNTSEDSKAPEDLKSRLHDAVSKLPNSEDDIRPSGDSGKTSGTN